MQDVRTPRLDPDGLEAASRVQRLVMAVDGSDHAERAPSPAKALGRALDVPVEVRRP